eukprot:739828-Hanusia_phi.AAC.1
MVSFYQADPKYSAAPTEDHKRLKLLLAYKLVQAFFGHLAKSPGRMKKTSRLVAADGPGQE